MEKKLPANQHPALEPSRVTRSMSNATPLPHPSRITDPNSPTFIHQFTPLQHIAQASPLSIALRKIALSPHNSISRSRTNDGQDYVHIGYKTVQWTVQMQRVQLVSKISEARGVDVAHWIVSICKPIGLPSNPLDWSTTFLTRFLHCCIWDSEELPTNHGPTSIGSGFPTSTATQHQGAATAHSGNMSMQMQMAEIESELKEKKAIVKSLQEELDVSRMAQESLQADLEASQMANETHEASATIRETEIHRLKGEVERTHDLEIENGWLAHDYAQMQQTRYVDMQMQDTIREHEARIAELEAREK